MEQRTKQDACRRDGLVTRLVQAQLAVSGLGIKAESPTAEDRWPARLIHAGAVLATWLRRRL